MAEPQRQALSRDDPWPGLDPFDETDREYFHGRSAETGELVRLVRRELLTVLFGRSGLGKTSLLKAGLFPLLREEDGLPVYIRLDHADGAPALREQIYRGLRTAGEANRIQASHPAEDETLWSYFHRRDAELWSERNRPVTPVIIFDQFEEIFTLGQESEAARVRSAAFLAELSDLIENRPPDLVRRELEADPTAARRFDFKRAAVKLVLSFREDFLAEVEELKGAMPSLMYNRYRLLAMSGTQAYEVITCAGGTLVDDDIARRILRLAWKNEPSPPVDPADFPRIEIDPALLSVVCTELNHKRQLTSPPLERITPGLLEGADREILSGFYERAMAGLDPRVRAFVEDELITQRGYRDSRALEDVEARVTPEAVDALIRRRLLRVDDRQGTRRLELTHDVLARVVKDSRDSRRVREQQRRNRRNTAFLAAGMVVALVLFGLTWRLAWEARQAKQQAASLLHQAKVTQLVATADRIQDASYDASLLINLEAVRAAQTPDTEAGLLRRFVSHPYISAFLTGHRDTVHVVAFSPDGKLLASGSWDNTIVLWDVDRRRPLARLQGHTKKIYGIAFSPDGKRLASGGQDQTIRLWDVASRKTLAVQPRPWTSLIRSLAFSPDGKLLAAADDDNSVTLWDADNLKLIGRLHGNKGVGGVAFSPDGRLLASGSGDHTVIVWDVETRKPLYNLKGHKADVNRVAFSPDSKRLASASDDRTVILWDLEGRKPLTALVGHKSDVLCVAFSPDGKRLASGGRDWTVILWDAESGRQQATLEGHKDEVFSVAFSRDSRWLASGSWDRTVILWDLNGTRLQSRLEDHGGGPVASVAFSPDGKRLAAASPGKVVTLWDIQSRKPLAALPGNPGPVVSVAFTPDGKRLAAAADQAIVLWDAEKHQPLDTLAGHDPIRGVAFSPDGKRLASASQDDTVLLWDVDQRRLLETLKGHQGEVYSVAFSPDGKRLASGSQDETVLLWGVDQRKPPETLRGHQGEVYGVAFSPDGKRLATANERKTVTLWDPDGRRPLRPLVMLDGHEGSVLSVAFSPDGKKLVSTSTDGSLILWDVESSRPLATLVGHKSAVLSAAFSPDGRWLASAGEDHTVILWDLGLEDLKAEACRTANRNLTCEEWKAYFDADQTYHKTCPELPGPETCN